MYILKFFSKYYQNKLLSTLLFKIMFIKDIDYSTTTCYVQKSNFFLFRQTIKAQSNQKTNRNIFYFWLPKIWKYYDSNIVNQPYNQQLVVKQNIYLKDYKISKIFILKPGYSSLWILYRALLNYSINCVTRSQRRLTNKIKMLTHKRFDHVSQLYVLKYYNNKNFVNVSDFENQLFYIDNKLYNWRY